MSEGKTCDRCAARVRRYRWSLVSRDSSVCLTGRLLHPDVSSSKPCRSAQVDSPRLPPREVLERVARTSRFTRFTTYAELVVPAGTNIEAARKLLEQAEHDCLIVNSLQGARSLEAQVIVCHQRNEIDAVSRRPSQSLRASVWRGCEYRSVIAMRTPCLNFGLFLKRTREGCHRSRVALS